MKKSIVSCLLIALVLIGPNLGWTQSAPPEEPAYPWVALVIFGTTPINVIAAGAAGVMAQSRGGGIAASSALAAGMMALALGMEAKHTLEKYEKDMATWRLAMEVWEREQERKREEANRLKAIVTPGTPVPIPGGDDDPCPAPPTPPDSSVYEAVYAMEFAMAMSYAIENPYDIYYDY